MAALLMVCGSVSAFAQEAPAPQQEAAAPAQQQPEGMIPRWEVVEIAQQLKTHAGGVEKILEQVRPKEWIQDGAPAAYVDQHESLLQDLGYLSRSAEILEHNPEKLTVVIDTFLWLDRLHSMIDSMSLGVRKYQSDPIADLLDSAARRNTTAIEQLKGYMRQLASNTENEMAIAYDETQRCRQELLTQPRK
ncbi:MAG: hypothetical protein GC160_24820 [Acidobacteria bacterium]|nr:hypothetical protein [Acidobacteriota bacterium]